MESNPAFELRHLVAESRAITAGEPNLIANLANIASLIFHSVPDLNWCGFYLKDPARHELVLGPFQGRPACIRIAKGKGICGNAWDSEKVMNVPDVQTINNHITCDTATRSELVLPIFNGGEFHGVLDLDSPLLNRFDPALEKILTELAGEVLPALF